MRPEGPPCSLGKVLLDTQVGVLVAWEGMGSQEQTDTQLQADDKEPSMLFPHSHWAGRNQAFR